MFAGCVPMQYTGKKGDKVAELNYATYYDYLTRLIEVAINIYEWHGLPETVDERFLELTLFSQGLAVFFEDEVMGFVATQSMIGGNLDIYRIPDWRTAYAVNGYNRQLSSKDSVLIFNNYLRTPSFQTIDLFAQRLAELERTIEVNVKAQKTPVLIECDEKQKLTMKNLYTQYDGNSPAIYTSKGVDMNSIRVLKTDAPYVGDKLQILKRQIWNEAMTYLGVENSNTEKKERMVTDEISSNLGSVESQRYVKLNARRQAARKINTMFGLDISVDFRSNTTTIDTSEDRLEVNVDV